MFRTKYVITTLLLVLLSSIALLPAHAATLTVTDCTSQVDLANTIAAAASGDTIDFSCGTATIPFTAEIIIDKDLTINGAGAITFDGGNATRFFTVNSGNSLTVDGITFQNGNGDFGGAIDSAGTLTISNSTFSGNSAQTGGAIANLGTLTISNSTISGNSATNAGGAIFNFSGTLTISNSTFSGNSATVVGGAIFSEGTFISQDTHYEGDATNNTCESDAITDNGGNTRVNSAGCPGSAPVNLDVAPLMCVDDNLLVLINAGDGNFNITGSGANLPLMDVPFGSYTILGMGPWSDVTITELLGDRESLNIGGITCPSGVIIPPSEPVAPIVTVLGCALDTTDGVEVANAPDNTYCRVLMTNGGVVNYSGAVPANLIGLGVILAVDVYRLEGGATINTFPNYTQICLAGSGRLFYMDARNAPYMSIELASESIGGATCGWIPAPGTLILTN